MRIDIEGRMHEGSWTIAVRDNGSGFPEEKLKELEKRLEDTRVKVLNLKDTVEVEIGGMGLINTYARCLLLFGPDLIFEIRNTGSGAEVVVGEKINEKKENNGSLEHDGHINIVLSSRMHLGGSVKKI